MADDSEELKNKLCRWLGPACGAEVWSFCEGAAEVWGEVEEFSLPRGPEVRRKLARAAKLAASLTEVLTDPQLVHLLPRWATQTHWDGSEYRSFFEIESQERQRLSGVIAELDRLEEVAQSLAAAVRLKPGRPSDGFRNLLLRGIAQRMGYHGKKVSDASNATFVRVVGAVFERCGVDANPRSSAETFAETGELGSWFALGAEERLSVRGETAEALPVSPPGAKPPDSA